jgi:hypothetical protein
MQFACSLQEQCEMALRDAGSSGVMAKVCWAHIKKSSQTVGCTVAELYQGISWLVSLTGLHAGERFPLHPQAHKTDLFRHDVSRYTSAGSRFAGCKRTE